MEVKVIKSGLLETNSYVVSKDSNCIIIDPAFAADKIKDYISKYNYNVLAILLTHGHFDHIEGCNELASLYDCKVYINKDDLELLNSSELNYSHKYLKRDIAVDKKYISVFNREIIMKLDNFMIDIIFTPGHSRGGCCYLIGNELFSGDTLFKNDTGRVDLYGGSKEDLDQSLKLLFNLKEDIVVFPGHGEDTTIGKEKHRYI